jgi:hypothetical protein
MEEVDDVKPLPNDQTPCRTDKVELVSVAFFAFKELQTISEVTEMLVAKLSTMFLNVVERRLYSFCSDTA